MDDYEMNQKKNVERDKKFLEEFKEYLILNKLSDKMDVMELECF